MRGANTCLPCARSCSKKPRWLEPKWPRPPPPRRSHLVPEGTRHLEGKWPVAQSNSSLDTTLSGLLDELARDTKIAIKHAWARFALSKRHWGPIANGLCINHLSWDTIHARLQKGDTFGNEHTGTRTNSTHFAISQPLYMPGKFVHVVCCVMSVWVPHTHCRHVVIPETSRKKLGWQVARSALEKAFNLDTRTNCMFLRKNSERHTECSNVIFHIFYRAPSKLSSSS